MAEIRRVLAAERQICKIYGSRLGCPFATGDKAVGVRERMIRRCRVISVAKYARWRNPVEDSLLEFGGVVDEEGESIRRHAGRAANQSLSFNCTGFAS